MKFKNIFSLIISCLLYAMAAKGQNLDKNFADSLAKHFDYYRLKKTQSVLFAHFDKTVYTNNENVWFTAYLLNSHKNRLNDVLSAILVKDDDRSIAVEEKFVMADGIAFGNLFLPDTLRSGDYSFILYTNEIYNGKPANIFVQPVTIKNTNEPAFHASLNLLDTDKFPVDGKRKVRLVTSAKGSTIIAGATVTYYAGNKAHPFFSGQAKTDHAGQYIFSIPLAGMSPNSNVFEARITFGKESNTTQLVLPVYTGVAQIKFYPEGGNLSDGVLSTVGWEAKNLSGAPLEMGAVLYRNDKPEDTIYTNAYGMGKFKLYPQVHSRYYLKPLGHIFKDSVYTLPTVMFGQPAVAIGKAITDDTLHLIIKAKTTQKVFVVVHNFRNVFFNFETEATTRGRPVKVILDDLPRGIAEITVLDSLRRPCAERLFFAHYNRRNTLQIHTDTDKYKKRQKITIDLKLMKTDGKAANGLVSIACVQANRLEVKKTTDIESYFYLTGPLGRLPVRERYMGSSDEDKKFLEDILLIRGWQRYTWPDLVNTSPADTIKHINTLNFTGLVTLYSKPLRKPMDCVIVNDSSYRVITTSANGTLIFRDSDLFTMENKTLHLFVSGTSDRGYNINLENPYLKIDKQLSDEYVPFYFSSFSAQNHIDNSEIKSLEGMIRLKEVNINGAADKQLYGANACGDYVCFHNILNCQNHRSDSRNRPAKIGETYLEYDPISLTLSKITYSGCSADTYKTKQEFTGIYYSAEFYPADYSLSTDPTPEYLSTIYWRHLIKISPTTKNVFSFYTSDITGEFKIIIQGISADDVVYGEKTFRVVK